MQQNGENAVRAVLESHFVSPAALAILLRSPLSRDDYEAFITERRHTVLEAIEELTPQLREVDQRAERGEILLRRQIDSTLAADVARLPPHVNQKIEERVQAATTRLFDA
jgi:hypothetical protein